MGPLLSWTRAVKTASDFQFPGGPFLTCKVGSETMVWGFLLLGEQPGKANTCLKCSSTFRSPRRLPPQACSLYLPHLDNGHDPS